MEFSKVSAMVANVSFLVCGVVNLVAGTYFGVAGNAIPAATCLSAGLVLLFAGTIDRFESLKGLGLEAKTRALDQTIAKAEVSLANLREVAELTGSALIGLTSATGRIGTAPTVASAYATSRRIKALLQKFGSSDAVIREALQPWADISAFDAANAARKTAADAIAAEAGAMKDERTEIYKQDGESEQFRRLTTAFSAAGEFAEELRRRNIERDTPANIAERLRELIVRAKAIDPRVEGVSERVLAPWITRIAFLASTYDLNDHEAWFATR